MIPKAQTQNSSKYQVTVSRRDKLKFLLTIGAGITLIVGALFLLAPPRESLPGSLIGPPSLSPDGRLIAFAYGKTVGNNALLLYDIESEQLRLIDKPSHLVVTRPSFSPDGQRVAVATFCKEGCEPDEKNYQIAIVDLDKEEMTFVTSGRDFVRTGPIFSHDGSALFFSAANLMWKDDELKEGNWWDDEWGESFSFGYYGISKVDRASGIEQQLFPAAQNGPSFLSIVLGGSLSSGDVVFSAYGPHDGEMEANVAEMNRGSDILGYTFHPDRGLDLLLESENWGMSGLTQAGDEGRRVFISSPPDDRFNYDLFLSMNGQVSQITHQATHMGHSSVSANGERVVFLADASRKRNWSIWLHDFLAGETKEELQYQAILKFLGVPESQEPVGVSTM